MSILSLFAQTPDYYDPYSTYGTQSTTLSGEQQAAIGVGVLAFMFIAFVVTYIITALCLSSIFKKAGVEGWKAWVPFYNSWVLLEIGGQKGYWAVLALIPFVNIVSAVFMYIAMYYIGLKLGKPGAFVLVAIFLPIVWLIWLAVDKSTWEGASTSAGTPTPSQTPPSPGQPTTPREV